MEFCDLKHQYQLYKEEIDQEIATVCESAAFIKGPQVQKFEQELTKYLGGTHESIGCASGTDALLIALMAFGVQPGDEIIIPDFTFIATGEVVSLLGAVPIFCDIDPHTYLIDPQCISDSITERTVGIIPVSMFGQCYDVHAVEEIAIKHHLWVLEDAAQSFGAEYQGKKSCTVSTAAATSFFPAKPLGCYGDGGALFTNDQDLADRMRMILNHGQSRRYEHAVVGINGRLDTLQAAVLSVKLRHFDQELVLRNQVAAQYTSKLKDLATTPQLLSGNTSVWAQYSIRHSNRDRMREVLLQKGIPTAVHYPIPLHKQKAFSYLNVQQNYPVTSLVSQEIFSLPMHPFLKEEDISYIADALGSMI